MEERNGETGQWWQGKWSCIASSSNLSSLRDSGKAGVLFFFQYEFFLLGTYFIYISNAIPKVPHTLPHPLPHPPTPTSWPWRFPVLRQIKFTRPMGLSFHWWRTRPSSDTYAARDTSSGEYWVVHIVVPPIRLQIPLAPWVLSLAPPLGDLWSIQ
jgi:hypothetical protein